jgi:hypothetical protein
LSKLIYIKLAKATTIVILDLLKGSRLKWNNPTTAEAAKRAAVARVVGRDRHPDFDETLKISAKAFINLRYSYEPKNQTALDFLAGDIMECTRRSIFEEYPSEYAEVRLPLPNGALSLSQQNAVHHSVMTTLTHKPVKRS